MFVEYDYLPLANEKTPFAANAVIQSGLALKDRVFSSWADDKLMSEDPASRRKGRTTLFPKVHDQVSRQFPDHAEL